MPLAASAIILWLLSTLAWVELAAAMFLVVVIGCACMRCRSTGEGMKWGLPGSE